MPDPALAGFCVGITADRCRNEQAALFRGQGARVMLGPALATVPLGHDHRLLAATRTVLDRRPDYVIVTTAVGLQTWLSAACLSGLDAPLRAVLESARVLGRGAKVHGAVSGAGLQAWWMAPSGTTAEVVSHLLGCGIAGSRVAVQHHGGDMPEIAALRAAGAEVIDVPLYRWSWPEDVRPAQRLIEAACRHRLDAVTFTSAPAVTNLFAITERMGQRDELRAALTSVVRTLSMGPVCTSALRAEGVDQSVEPERTSLAGLVRVVTEELGRGRRRLRLAGLDTVVQGSLVRVDGHVVQLSDRERAVLELLCQRAGTVVHKARLLSEVWASGDPDHHTVDVTVGRLRRRLGPAGAAIRTVPRRGYWLDTGEEVGGPGVERAG